MTLLYLAEAYNTINGSVNSEVLANVGARTSDFGRTSLTDEDFACRNFLATKALYAKALTGIIVDVLA
jgi:hypothetical protein